MQKMIQVWQMGRNFTAIEDVAETAAVTLTMAVTAVRCKNSSAAMCCKWLELGLRSPH